MLLQKMMVGIYGANCYIIGDEKTQKAVVVDPGGNGDDILKAIEENGMTVEYVMLTHGHGDHIGAVKDLMDAGAKLIAHKDEAEILKNKDLNLTSQMGENAIEVDANLYVSDDANLRLGDLNFKFIHTPGHTPGGMCILIENVLFTGDTLFAGSIGRTDLYGGDYDVMMESLKKLAQMDGSLNVLPGHGPASTIENEKAVNPFLRNI